MSRKSGFSGITKLRKTLRRVDPELSEGLKKIVRDGASDIARDMADLAPRDDGDLRASISYKVGSDGFTAIIGPGADRASVRSKGFKASKAKYTKAGNMTKATLKDKHARYQLYKALWLEFGTKAGKKGSAAQPARPFIAPAMDINRMRISARATSEINRIIKRAADGG